MNFLDLLNYSFSIGSHVITLSQVILAGTIILFVPVLLYLFEFIFLKRFFRQHEVDIGRRYAIKQFIKYIAYTFSILSALQVMGIQFSILWGGAAALLVGIGLGLQQTFNDLVSGLILLIEGTVEVGDVVKVNGIVGRVQKIGIRTSKVESRDKISIIIPNSKLVVDHVTNWSHNAEPSRFQLNVGVAYSADCKKVSQLLLQVAEEHPDVLNIPKAQVQFRDFGDSSLDFSLHFFSNEYLRIEFVKSELRFNIIELFKSNKIEIPFPQRDLWIRNDNLLTSTTNTNGSYQN